MKVMLLGGAGFIGLNLANSLLRNGHEVHIADRVASPVNCSRLLPAVDGYHMISSEDTGLLLDTIDALGIECVVGLASSLIPSSTIEEFEGEMAGVMMPSFRLLESLASRRVRFVYVSSGGTVYGASSKAALNESDPLRPISHYGCSKVLFEHYLEFVARSQNLICLILRPSNPFGPFQNPFRKQGLVAVAVENILHDRPIEIWGDGSVVRDYLWVEDLADAVAALLPIETAWGQVFNIGSGQGHSVNELLLIIQEMTGKTADIRYQESRTVDIQSVVLDISRLRRTVPFEPLQLRQALDRYLKDLRR